MSATRWCIDSAAGAELLYLLLRRRRLLAPLLPLLRLLMLLRCSPAAFFCFCRHFMPASTKFTSSLINGVTHLSKFKELVQVAQAAVA